MAEQSRVKILDAHDLGNDVLRVRGHVEGYDDRKGKPLVVIAEGWVSALEQHFPPEDYRDDGHRRPGATPRPMTGEERRAYLEGLLRAAAGPALPAPVPISVE